LTRDEKIAAGGAVAVAGILAWYFWPRKAVVPRLKSELVIDDNVMSPNFGLPMYGPPVPAGLDTTGAINPDMARLIKASNAAIAADDAANKG
jgi:hypothetical protein